MTQLNAQSSGLRFPVWHQASKHLLQTKTILIHNRARKKPSAQGESLRTLESAMNISILNCSFFRTRQRKKCCKWEVLIAFETAKAYFPEKRDFFVTIPEKARNDKIGN